MGHSWPTPIDQIASQGPRFTHTVGIEPISQAAIVGFGVLRNSSDGSLARRPEGECSYNILIEEHEHQVHA
jgi:hypothetical protein